MCIPTNMFCDDLDDSLAQSNASDAESKDEPSDPLATPLEPDNFEYPKVCFLSSFLFIPKVSFENKRQISVSNTIEGPE